MWETSNRPAAVRTARCSSITPRYCTGISQPAKGTSFAPAARWASYSGVRLSGPSGAIGSNPSLARFRSTESPPQPPGGRLRRYHSGLGVKAARRGARRAAWARSGGRRVRPAAPPSGPAPSAIRGVWRPKIRRASRRASSRRRCSSVRIARKLVCAGLPDAAQRLAIGVDLDREVAHRRRDPADRRRARLGAARRDRGWPGGSARPAPGRPRRSAAPAPSGRRRDRGRGPAWRGAVCPTPPRRRAPAPPPPRPRPWASSGRAAATVTTARARAARLKVLVRIMRIGGSPFAPETRGGAISCAGVGGALHRRMCPWS